MLNAVLFCVAGLIGLGFGGELLVRGAVGIAERLGLSAMVTGVVIVGSATSMPEMVTSVGAALKGAPGIAWGNIAGSNIANSLLILGATVLVAPIALHGAGRRDAVVALMASAAVWAIAAFHFSSMLLGIGLLALLVVYIVWRLGHPPETPPGDEGHEKPPTLLVSSFMFLIGVGILVAGGYALVTGAVDLARLFGISEPVIGLTVVAIGTSLPELAATLAAALRGKPDLALGNVLGSNIYNLLLIGGTTMSLAPAVLPVELLPVQWALVFMTALALLLMTWFMHRIGRVLGVLLLAVFAANTALAVIWA